MYLRINSGSNRILKQCPDWFVIRCSNALYRIIGNTLNRCWRKKRCTSASQTCGRWFVFIQNSICICRSTLFTWCIKLLCAWIILLINILIITQIKHIFIVKIWLYLISRWKCYMCLFKALKSCTFGQNTGQLISVQITVW